MCVWVALAHFSCLPLALHTPFRHTLNFEHIFISFVSTYTSSNGRRTRLSFRQPEDGSPPLRGCPTSPRAGCPRARLRCQRNREWEGLGGGWVCLSCLQTCGGMFAYPVCVLRALAPSSRVAFIQLCVAWKACCVLCILGQVCAKGKGKAQASSCPSMCEPPCAPSRERLAVCTEG